jgi:hypothetical protein
MKVPPVLLPLRLLLLRLLPLLLVCTPEHLF